MYLSFELIPGSIYKLTLPKEAKLFCIERPEEFAGFLEKSGCFIPLNKDDMVLCLKSTVTFNGYAFTKLLLANRVGLGYLVQRIEFLSELACGVLFEEMTQNE
jgi:hypothetical protein